MKLIEAVIQPARLDAVKEALVALGINGLTTSEVRGFGRQRGHRSQFRGTEYRIELIPKTRVEVIVSDSSAAVVTEVIARAARTGEPGDGKVFIYPLEKVLRIRTGEIGEAAV